MRTHHRTLLALLAVFAPLGCAQELVLEEQHSDSEPVLLAEGDGLLEQLQEAEDGWSLSPVMHQGDFFDRLAFRFDSSTPFAIQARFSSDAGETWGEWGDVEVTWNENVAFNAHADADVELPTTAQLRFMAPVEAGLSFLAAELIERAHGDSDDLLAPEGQVEQGLAADGVVVTRAAWGAIPRNCGSNHTPNKITVHHTVTPNNDSMPMAARVRQIQAFHINGRGWCDIGYHFLVGQDGQVYQGRYENRTGAHAANANYANVGVSYVGNFQDAVPSSAMLNAGARIIKALTDSYGIPRNRSRVVGHRQVGTTSTACPGQHLYARLDELLALASGSDSAPPPAPAAPPSPGCGRLDAGASLAPGQSKMSCDGRFTFVHQTDGNVVLYQGSTPLWATATHGKSTGSLAMQGDGNLVLYTPSGAPLWASGTHGRPGAFLALQNDGNAVIYQGSTPRWATNTCCR